MFRLKIKITQRLVGGTNRRIIFNNSAESMFEMVEQRILNMELGIYEFQKPDTIVIGTPLPKRRTVGSYPSLTIFSFVLIM